MSRNGNDDPSASEVEGSKKKSDKERSSRIRHADPLTLVHACATSPRFSEGKDEEELMSPPNNPERRALRRGTIPGNNLSYTSQGSAAELNFFRDSSRAGASTGESSFQAATSENKTEMNSHNPTGMPLMVSPPDTPFDSTATSRIDENKTPERIRLLKSPSGNNSSPCFPERATSSVLLGENPSSLHGEQDLLEVKEFSPRSMDPGGASFHPQLGISFYNLSHENLSTTFTQENFSTGVNFKASYARRVPPHLRSLVEEIHDLDDHDLTHIAYVTEAMVKKEVYSLLPYSGANWFLPEVSRADKERGEKQWGADYRREDGLIITIGGMRLSLPILNFFIRLGLLALLWLLLWFVVAREMEPGGYVFDPVILLLVSAVIGGLLCRILSVPPLVGVMWIAIMWHNIPELNYLTTGISTQVMEVASKAGLTVILAKAGYSISLTAMKPHWKQTLLLATVPFAVEGVTGSLIANAIMPYNGRYTWAFLQGMLCAVASPAVVIPGAHFLKNLGYDEEKDKKEGVGPLSLMISAIPLEIVLGIWCSNFILSLLFEQQTVVVAAILAPVQLAGGACVGFGIGWVFHGVTELLKHEAARLPNGRFPPAHFRSRMKLSFVLYLVLCLVMVIGGYKLKLAGGGCVMCVSFCATVSYIWCKPRKIHRVRDVPLHSTARQRRMRSRHIRSRKFGQRFHKHICRHSYSSSHFHNFRTSVHASTKRLRAVETLRKEVIDELKEQKLFFGAYLSDLWDELMMPVLFAAMGARIDLVSVFNKSFFPRAISILLISTIIRFICIMTVQCCSPMHWKRRLLVGIGYLGKASAQASVGPLAASMMSVNGVALWGPGGVKEDIALFEEYSVYATYLRNITALYVMVMAVVASIGVVRGGVILLDLKKIKKSKSADLVPEDSATLGHLSKDLA